MSLDRPDRRGIVARKTRRPREAALALTLLLGLPQVAASSPPAGAAPICSADLDEVATAGCGTELTAEGVARHLELEGLGAYRLPPGRTTDAWLVRTAIHIVRTDEGTGGLSEQDLAAALARANTDLAPAMISLLPIRPIDYIDSDAFYYEIDTTVEINALRSTNPVPHALNIYFTPILANENGSFCGISSFSWNPYQGVVIMNACLPSSWNPSTFTHELGHYFDLLHTHETAYGAECVDGSNCVTAGDRLCDTPADPRLNRCGSGGNQYCVDAACNYTGVFLDPCHADPYDPMTENMMSYSRPLCRTGFTPGQRVKAEATLLNVRSDHVIEPAGLEPGPGEAPETAWLALGAPAPNPTSGSTTTDLAMRRGGPVRARVYDAAGRTVAQLLDRDLGIGGHRLTWSPDDRLPAGIYFLRVSTGPVGEVRVIVRLRPSRP